VRYAALALQTLHAQLPRQSVVLVVDTSQTPSQTASPSANRDDTARAVLRLLRRLWQERVILGSLLYDGRASPLAQEVGQLRQLEQISTTLASLLLAYKHAVQNETMVGALALLCREMPFLRLSVGSAALPPGAPLARLDPGRWTTARTAPVGRGDLDATRTRLLALLTHVRTEDRYHTLTAPDAARWGRPLAICTYPFHPRDDRFQAVAETLERAVGAAIPGSSSLMSSGNGCWDGGLGARYFAQVGLLHGWDLPEAWEQAADDDVLDAADDKQRTYHVTDAQQKPTALMSVVVPRDTPRDDLRDTATAPAQRPLEGSVGPVGQEGQKGRRVSNALTSSAPSGGVAGSGEGQILIGNTGTIGTIGRHRGRPRGDARRPSPSQNPATPPPSGDELEGDLE
jgi:hypothetical protein